MESKLAPLKWSEKFQNYLKNRYVKKLQKIVTVRLNFE